MIESQGLAAVRASAVAAALTSSAPPARENLLRNGGFERSEPLGGVFRRPTAWRASAFSPAAGAVTAACPAALARRARPDASVAWLNDSLPGAGRPACLYQTVTLDRGPYRFGGRLAVRIWDSALDAAARRVTSASQAFLRLYRGPIDFETPSSTGGPRMLLGSIDLSPQRFAFGAFRRVAAVGSMVRFAYLAFDLYEDTFVLDGDGPFDVTLQLEVVPRVPGGEVGPHRLVALTQITLLADHLFIERAQP